MLISAKHYSSYFMLYRGKVKSINDLTVECASNQIVF
jgi:hypothetical protein